METSVVTLMVLPEDAERIALAQNEGKLNLALRNPLDVQPTTTQGIRMAALLSPAGTQPEIDPVANKVVKKIPVPRVKAPAPVVADVVMTWTPAIPSAAASRDRSPRIWPVASPVSRSAWLRTTTVTASWPARTRR